MKLKIVNYTISDYKIPKELSGYRIALFSDTHNNFYGENYEDIIRPIASINPDIVVFAGDAVNKRDKTFVASKGIEYAFPLFSRLAQDYKIYYAIGNHEKRWQLYSDNPNSYMDYIKQLRDTGVFCLFNESIEVENGLVITGLDLPYEYYKKLNGKGIDSIVKDIDSDKFNIFIAHTPVYAYEYEKMGADLILSGHMHGGLLRLPFLGGVVSPHVRFFPKYDYGLFDVNDSKMIVSSGAGDHLPRINFNNPREIVSIELMHKEL